MSLECRFCQCDVAKQDAYKFVDPKGRETVFCEECAGDMIKHVESGEAEKDKMSSINSSASWNTIADGLINASNWDNIQSINTQGIKIKSIIPYGMPDEDDVPF